MTCLNINNKEVKAALDELTSVLGDADAAYYIISENNGYAIDQAPNGAQSKLFSDLLDHYNGNREQAIKTKAKLFSDSFKNWFGDWINGNPFSEGVSIDSGSFNPDNVDMEGYRPEFIFRKDGEYVGSFHFDDLVRSANGEILKNSMYLTFPNVGMALSIEKEFRGKGLGKAMYYEAAKYAAIRGRVLRSAKLDNISEDAIRVWKSLIKSGYAKFDNNRYIFNNDKLNYSKVIDENGEPLIVYHYSDNSQLDEFSIEFDNYFSTIKGGTKKAIFFTGNKKPKQNTVLNRPNKYPVFLNARSIIEKTGTKDELKVQGEGFVSTINRAANEADAAIFHGIDDNQELNQDIYVINNPNNVKSVANQGTFSTQDNNIYNQQIGVQYNYDPEMDYHLQKIFNGSAETTVSKVLEVLSFYYTGTRFDRLYNLFKDTDIPVVLSYDTKYMSYNASTNTIKINPRTLTTASFRNNLHGIMHEIVHAYTVSSLRKVESGKNYSQQEKQVYETVNKLYKKVLLLAGPRETKGVYYGLTNVHEFVSELLTNQEFVDTIIEAATKQNKITSIKELLHELWRKITNLITHGYTKNDIENVQEDLFNLISFNIDNDIPQQYARDTTYDLIARQEQAVYNMELNLEELAKEKEQFDKITHNLSQTINAALSSRLKIYDNPDPVIKQQMIKTMEWQIQNITQGLVSDYENIVNFLQQSADEIKSTSEFLIKAKKNNQIIDDNKLNDLDQNFFSFYCGILDDIVQQLIYREPYREIVGKDGNGNYKLDKLIKRAKNYQAMLNEGQLIVKGEIARNASKILKEVGVEVGAVTIYRYEQTDPTSYDKDISYLTYLLGAGDKIKDDCIKSIFYLINGAEEKTRKAVYAKQDKLLKLLGKVNKYNQLQLFEVDDNGNTTGYFVRSRNYGKFEAAYKKEMEDICMKLGIDITDIYLPENREVRIQYNKLRNDWLSKNCERRFTADYYEAFNHLSNETQQQRESIQINIRNLQNKARDEYGIVRLERLSPAERDQLKKHQLEKKQLASLYDINGRKKQGIQLQIAQELTELNEKLSKGITLTKNSKAYESERDKIMSDKKLTKEQKQEWLELNSKVSYKEEFYQKLKKIAKKYYDEEYAALQERRRAILSMFRDDATGEIDVNTLPQSTKNALSALSRRMTQIRKTKKAKTLEGEYAFEDIADSVPTKQWYVDKRKFYDSVIADDPEAAQIWLQQNAYTIKVTGSDGRVTVKTVPKSWYTKLVPKDEKMIERVPNNNWLEVSEDSPFYNKAYYQAQMDHPELKDEYWIPKEDKYDSSDRYQRIQSDPNVKALYDELLSVMKEANDQYTNLNKKYPYRTPQMSGSLYRYIGNEWRTRSGISALASPFKGFEQWIVDKLSVRNDDKGFNKALTKPNGERLNLIPQNYIKRLDNPAVLSANAVGDVIEYYKSAMDWKYKKEIQPKVELLKSHVLGKTYLNKKGEVKTEETNVSKFVKAFIDMNLYDIKSQTVTISFGNNKSGKMFGIIPYKGNIFNLINYDISKPREINITKMLAILRTLGTVRNLALNLWCALTGGFTALHSHIINSLVGRYYNPVEAAYALKDMLVDLLINVPNKFGITNRKPFMSKCMEYFEVGAEMKPDPTNRNHLVNMVNKHWGFGVYTFQDHLIKGQILGSIMNNYKLVIDENGNKKFMSREEYKRVNKLDTFVPGDILDWNFGDKLSFRDAVDFVGGELVAKDPTNQQAVDAVKDEIAYLARSMSQSADGQLTDLQRSVIFSNAAGQFLMMHRQYLPVIIQERFTMSRQFDYQTKRYKEAVFQTPYRLFMEAIENNENILKTFKNAYIDDAASRENLKKIPIEITSWVIICQLIRPLLSSSADDDKKNILKQLLAYVMERTSFEIMAPYNVIDMVRNVKSPSPIISYIENMSEFAQSPMNLLINYGRTAIKGELINNKVIKRGAYKGMTEFEKTMIKITPFKNLIELKDIQSKRNYYRKQILGE